MLAVQAMSDSVPARQIRVARQGSLTVKQHASGLRSPTKLDPRSAWLGFASSDLTESVECFESVLHDAS